ncbi:sodium- and chloride-dependent creatine transporter 1-like [Stylophora pistillata]|uniref:sodium- and chloride-dependent creatine transporter 1-like n=1 Tax=Stylophora pistillata TaxID=50429 RepID=UPI000C05417E|nr:sodium- and chloride-dependent creatine transporter 1-like [Stylophora pistillata]
MAEGVNERETWGSKFDFILALMGFSIGLGNIWRFPYLCFKNGGGCFLIPYLICLIVAGVPVLVMEIGLGQYTSQGGITAWKICPIFQGIGYAGVLVMQYINIYYTVILGWAFYYMFASFQSKLPWSHCGNEWNTPNCVDGSVKRNSSIQNTSAIAGISVVYFTATAPYLLLTAILIRGVTLPGAADGIKFYLTPDLSRLGDGQVWLDAGTQVFFSYSIGMGTMTALGSYNKFRNNFYRDSIIFTLCNSGTSFYGGFLIFSVLGFMAKNQGVTVEEVAKPGPGLAFVVYPEAVAQMPLSPLWSALFFFMVILLGLDSEFVGIEGVVTAVVDLYPRYLRRGYRKEMFTAFVCVIWFLLGLAMVTEKCPKICTGRHRFYDKMEIMLGFRINPWIGWCWCFLAPIFCSFIFIFNLATYKPLKYGQYVYPGWGQTIGWLLTVSSLTCIPAVMICKLVKTTGTIRERLNKLITPEIEVDRQETELEDHKQNQVNPLTETNVEIEQKA